MTLAGIRDLLMQVELEDNHAFATAYVAHAEVARAGKRAPMPLPDAVQRWLQSHSL